MSRSDDIWILGIHMTKFGKHPNLDVVDLGAEAIQGALADAGVTMADIGILAAGNLLGSGSIAQQLQKQVGQTGIPAYNVSNACATGADVAGCLPCRGHTLSLMRWAVAAAMQIGRHGCTFCARSPQCLARHIDHMAGPQHVKREQAGIV